VWGGGGGGGHGAGGGDRDSRIADPRWSRSRRGGGAGDERAVVLSETRGGVLSSPPSRAGAETTTASARGPAGSSRGTSAAEEMEAASASALAVLCSSLTPPPNAKEPSDEADGDISPPLAGEAHKASRVDSKRSRRSRRPLILRSEAAGAQLASAPVSSGGALPPRAVRLAARSAHARAWEGGERGEVGMESVGRLECNERGSARGLDEATSIGRNPSPRLFCVHTAISGISRRLIERRIPIIPQVRGNVAEDAAGKRRRREACLFARRRRPDARRGLAVDREHVPTDIRRNFDF